MKKWLISAGASIIAALAPIQSMIISIFLLVILDLITGVWSAKKQGKVVTSAGLRRSLTKVFVYEIALIAGFIVEYYLMSRTFPIINIVTSIIGIVEISSIFENLNKIYGINIFKTIVGKLGSINDTNQSK